MAHPILLAALKGIQYNLRLLATAEVSLAISPIGSKNELNLIGNVSDF
jgi:hypothetical protein